MEDGGTDGGQALSVDVPEGRNTGDGETVADATEGAKGQKANADQKNLDGITFNLSTQYEVLIINILLCSFNQRLTIPKIRPKRSLIPSSIAD